MLDRHCMHNILMKCQESRRNNLVQLCGKLQDEYLGWCKILDRKEGVDTTRNSTFWVISDGGTENKLLEADCRDEIDEKEVEINQDIVKKSRQLQRHTRFTDQRGKYSNILTTNFHSANHRLYFGEDLARQDTLKTVCGAESCHKGVPDIQHSLT